jgi:hypothetical protein
MIQLIRYAFLLIAVLFYVLDRHEVITNTKLTINLFE